MSRTIPLILLATLSACGDDATAVPADPTWFADVRPIVIPACGPCHGPRPVDQRVAGLRLDRYVAGDDASLDAWDYREAIVRQAVDREAPAMPPDTILPERARDVLAAWLADGAPKGSRANTPPTAAIAGGAVPARVDQALAVSVTVGDADADPVVAALVARDAVSDQVLATHPGLVDGNNDVTFDTGQLASGRTIELLAVVDDGWSDDPAVNHHEVSLASGIVVDHGARGTAPTVQVLSPNGGETLLGVTTITWSATDPDPGDTLAIDVDLVRVAADGTETVAAAIVHGASGSSYSWNPAGIPIEAGGVAITYRVRVTATDHSGPNVRSDASDGTFTIAPAGGPTTWTWADVKPVFVTYCKQCHGQPARTAALEAFRLDKYDASDPEPPTNTDLGVYEERTSVYNRFITQGNMPPAAAPQPTAAEKAKVRDWLLGGAPRGGGGDGPPTLSWLTPNDSTITTTSTGMVTLAWTASDPEGLPLTGAISFAHLSAMADATARCDATVTGWVSLPVAVGAGSYAWTLPSTGYFCVRGQVTDAGGNSITRLAGRPIKYRTTPGP